MAMIEVKCPMCRQTDVVKHGMDAKGKRRCFNSVDAI